MILVTGASGNVGTELARILMARQVPFRGMVGQWRPHGSFRRCTPPRS
jgi:uncharacterized protein YbjT (DUF2867 family)